MFKAVGLILFAIMGMVYLHPLKKAQLLECHGYKCPPNTRSCDQFGKLSGKIIYNTVRCLDENDEPIGYHNYTTPWTLGGTGASYQSYSYTAYYSSNTNAIPNSDDWFSWSDESQSSSNIPSKSDNSNDQESVQPETEIEIGQRRHKSNPKSDVKNFNL